MFNIQQELESVGPQVPYEAVLGSTLDVELLDDLFRRLQPEIIYHAAAFKHVPLLERNPFAAVRNNAVGTWTLTKAAVRHQATKLILISTDKAVNPRSVMGASKRIAELAVVAMSTSECPMNAIRLMNVIGSSGSVVPAMLQEIAERQPITVTDPEARRWFLSLRETVHAVLASSAASCEGRILVPEVGEPTRILELAEHLRAEVGDEHAKELPIHFIGLRPGEKLSEDLTYKAEMREGVVDGLLGVWKTRRLGVEEIEEAIAQLSTCVNQRDGAGLIRTLCSVVPEYVPSGFLMKRYDPVAAS